ncbi:MAG: hypothetical protein IKX74_04135 [Erysipelotrichaceae bacterium]|nr:hypothetical protein [Erysipelotrichaceae bacterium]
MKKMLVCLLTAGLFLTLLIQPVRAEDYYVNDRETYQAQWSLDYFKTASVIYDPDLAMCALTICASASQPSDVIITNLQAMGFSNIVRLNYDQKIINKPVTTIASQSSGEDYYFVINIRGTKDVEDAVTDVMGGVFNGFILAGENTYQMFTDYRHTYCPEATDEHCYVLICGHSLGGATAGQLARQFAMKSLIDKKHIYTYTFASPTYDTEGENPQDYDNVFNHIISEDIVPTVPWQYERIGIDIRYTDDAAAFTFFDYISTVFYMENWTERVPAMMSHHALRSYYEVMKKGNYDNSTAWQRFFRNLATTVLELAERCLR